MPPLSRPSRQRPAEGEWSEMNGGNEREMDGPIWRGMMGPYGPAWAGGLQCYRARGRPPPPENSRDIDRRREGEMDQSAHRSDLSAFASLAVTRARRKRRNRTAPVVTVRGATAKDRDTPQRVVVSLRRAGSAVGSSGEREVGMAGDRMSWARLLKWSLSYIEGARPSRAIR